MYVINQNQEINTNTINSIKNIDEVEGIRKYSSWIYPKKIPAEICDLIVKDLQKCESTYGTVGRKNNIDLKTRFVKIVNVPIDHWSLGILLYFGFDANFVNFGYNVNNLAFTTFLTYEKGMFYSPHNDVGEYINDPSYNRKLTVILQLSDENDYEGGDVILYDSSLKPQKMSKEKGTIIVFNSSTTHSVSKLKNGIRHSLCGWIMGPPFA